MKFIHLHYLIQQVQVEVHDLTYTNNEMATILFCSYLGIEKEDAKPFSTKEWNALQERITAAGFHGPEVFLDKPITEIEEVMQLNEEEKQRIEGLLSRGAIVGLLLEKYSKRGIHVVTRADKRFPKLLRNRLKLKTPPILFYCGELDLANKMGIAVVGSRNIEEQGYQFVQELVAKAVREKLAIFSGGAKGIDSVAQQAAIDNGGIAVSYIADAMTKKIQNRDILKAIESKQLLLLSDTNPDLGFTVAKAMNRNKYIYASSCGAIAVAADLKKGGTWTGAIENINHKWVSLGVWNTNIYTGNEELISRGGIPIEKIENFSFQTLIDKTFQPIEQETVYQMELFPSKVGEEKEKYNTQKREELKSSYDIMLPYILQCLESEKKLEEICKEFDTIKTQMQQWLNRAVSEGKIEKLTRPIRYKSIVGNEINS